MVLSRRSVSKAPGSRLLMVTLRAAMPLRARPATKPVSPLRAPFDSPSTSIGAFTADEVMLTMRPKPRALMPSMLALMSSIGVSMLASTALIQASRSQLRKSPGGGPPALLTRMSTCGHAASAAARPSAVVMSPATARTSPLPSARNCAAACSSASAPRAVITTFTPSLTSAAAQPLPSPLLEAHTSAHLPAIPKSIASPPLRQQPDACEHQHRAARDPRGEGLAEDHHAHQDGGQRPDHADLGRRGGADALDRHHDHHDGRDRAQRRIEHREPDHL